MQNLVIFDWDGVIADSCPHFMTVYRKTTEDFGRIFPISSLEEFRDWYDSSWENNFINLGFSPEEVPVLIEYEASLVNYLDIPLFPGIENTLRDLAGRYVLAIASTTHSYHIKKKLADQGLESLFALIEGGEGGTSDKKGIVSKVIESLAIARESTVMIGDTVMDITSSRAAGIRNIAVSYGWNTHNKLIAAAPDFMIPSHKEIPLLLNRIFSAD
jgi:phosphoglycolate phosphatase-like HAD superfamily hydrolase